MSAYSPATHFTCADCGRRLPNEKRHESKLICGDRSKCLAVIATRMPALASFDPVTLHP